MAFNQVAFSSTERGFFFYFFAVLTVRLLRRFHSGHPARSWRPKLSAVQCSVESVARPERVGLAFLAGCLVGRKAQKLNEQHRIDPAEGQDGRNRRVAIHVAEMF